MSTLLKVLPYMKLFWSSSLELFVYPTVTHVLQLSKVYIFPGVVFMLDSLLFSVLPLFSTFTETCYCMIEPLSGVLFFIMSVFLTLFLVLVTSPSFLRGPGHTQHISCMLVDRKTLKFQDYAPGNCLAEWVSHPDPETS